MNHAVQRELCPALTSMLALSSFLTDRTSTTSSQPRESMDMTSRERRSLRLDTWWWREGEGQGWIEGELSAVGRQAGRRLGTSSGSGSQDLAASRLMCSEGIPWPAGRRATPGWGGRWSRGDPGMEKQAGEEGMCARYRQISPA